MTSEQIRLLNNIGFEWSLRNLIVKRYTQKSNQFNRQWDERYKELVTYVKEFGDTRVPQKYTKNPALGRWVYNQRQKYKKVLGEKLSGMTSKQIRLLNNI